MNKINILRIELEKRFDLPGGQYFEVSMPENNIYRISILEEAGGCTVHDWKIDGIDIPIPTPADFAYITKTDILKEAAKAASDILTQQGE